VPRCLYLNRKSWCSADDNSINGGMSVQLGHASIQTTLDRYGHLLPLKNYMGVGKRLDEKVFALQKGEKIVELT